MKDQSYLMNTERKTILINNKKYDYEEMELFHGRKKMDVEIARENLKLFHLVLEQSGITYGLFFGTLLGAIREKNFIVNDEDTDIYILSEDQERFLNLLFEFRNYGLQLVRLTTDLVSLMRKNEYIDVYIFRPKYKFGIYKLRGLNHFEYPAKNLENPVKKMFLGLQVLVPNDPETVLEKIYGKNWRIPISNYHAPENTLYRKISRLAPKVRKFRFYRALEPLIKNVLKTLGL
jgi:lipopolysaccharide cholinephosphotransferase